MIRTIPLIGLLLMVLTGAAAGCHRADRELTRRLHTADRLMDQQPDSALAILQNLPTDSLTRLRPWYALLYNKALLKNHRVAPDDSLISLAADYYSGRGDSLDYQSAYYRGVVYNSMGSLDRSLVSLYEAYEKATAVSDRFYQAMSARELSGVYAGIDNLKKELEWAEKAKRHFIEADKPIHAAWMDINISSVLTYNHQPLEALELIAEVDSTRLREDHSFRTKILKNKATAQYMAADYPAALTTYTGLIDEGVDIGANNKLRLASTLMKLGRYDEARLWVNEAESNRMYAADSLYSLSLRADFHAHNGNMAEAYKYRTEYARNLGKSDENKLTSYPTDLLTDTYILRADNQKLKIKSAHLTILVEALLCLLLIGGIIFLWLFLRARLRLQQEESEKLFTEAKILRDDLAFSRQAIRIEEERSRQLREESEAMERNSAEREHRYIDELRSLFANHVDVLNEMCASWYRNDGSTTDSRMKNDLAASLSRFSEPATVDDMVKIIDRYDDGWMSKFREAYPELSFPDYILAIYLYLGFMPESIVMLMKKKNLQAIYIAKYRLRLRLMKSESFEALNIASKLGLVEKNSKEKEEKEENKEKKTVRKTKKKQK